MFTYRISGIIVATIAFMLLAVQAQSAFAVNPNYRTDRQIHGVLTHGNKGTIYESYPTLTNQANVSWAKSFIGEFILTWDSFSSSAVGAGWLHFKHNNDFIQSNMAVYYSDANNGATGFAFYGNDPGSTFSALTLRGFYDSANNCYVWYRTVGSWSEDKCIRSFSSGLGEIWSISASNSNYFSSSTEYTSLQYYPASGGGATNWSSLPVQYIVLTEEVSSQTMLPIGIAGMYHLQGLAQHAVEAVSPVQSQFQVREGR